MLTHDPSPRRHLVAAMVAVASLGAAAASLEGYTLRNARADPQPYHGYFYRVLTAQGPHTPGGARSYVREGRMTDGFALVAYPAERGSSGIMTFVVGSAGIVFQKDLGEGAAEAAKTMAAYDPGESFSPVPQVERAPDRDRGSAR